MRPACLPSGRSRVLETLSRTKKKGGKSSATTRQYAPKPKIAWRIARTYRPKALVAPKIGLVNINVFMRSGYFKEWILLYIIYN